ncbi:hypothetical protein LZQ00_04190 [Sphingobacterium sp. SRCM116780]|uniref:hypothetical protein n=1 Tax=Sphingobacterium sp. SRCM116780 TaxID=2907623 RepID=UPI001F323DBC|nr:hypothetical protein [Sphingobacterium sp. SRCM116780]UIR57018.1 hypothetical protein LZQ00_04190 [Sphingobacterium sp. SRCM116780]
MEANIKSAVAAGISTYGRVDNIDTKTAFLARVETVFDTDGKYIDKLALLDEAFDDYPLFDELREVYVDLLLMNFFSTDVQKLEEDYLDSEEWEKIEDETIDRGTELLNIFLYLRECKDDEIEPDLDDYLKEFLLVDEDEFQDEHEIYEDIIANQILVESTFAEIAKTAKTIQPGTEVYELFYAILSFFSEINPNEAQFAEYESQSGNKAFDAAIYQIIVNFYKG